MRESSKSHTRTKIRRRDVYAGRLRFQVIPDRQGETLRPFAAAAVEPGSAVTTEGWIGYDGLPALGYRDEAVVILADQQVTDNYYDPLRGVLEFENVALGYSSTPCSRSASVSKRQRMSICTVASGAIRS